jgi:hypothetical protein
MGSRCERNDERSSSGKGAELQTQQLLASHDEICCMELLKTPFILPDLNCKDTGKFITLLKGHIMKAYREVEV